MSERLPLPVWAKFGATFAIAGQRYRIVAIGSTNRHAYPEFEDFIRCEPVEGNHFELPPAPCQKADVKAALGALFTLPSFRPQELGGAYLIEERADGR